MVPLVVSIAVLHWMGAGIKEREEEANLLLEEAARLKQEGARLEEQLNGLHFNGFTRSFHAVCRGFSCLQQLTQRLYLERNATSL